MDSPVKREADERELLFGGSSNETTTTRRRRRKKQGNADSATMSEAAAIQASLRRTQDRLQNELERVSNVASAIDNDDKLLKDTMNDHQSLNVDKAKRTLTALERAQQQEQRYLMASVAFFWVALFYVVWCRILIRLPFVDRLQDLIWSYVRS